MKSLKMAVVFLTLISLVGCNAASVAQKAETGVAVAISIAQADVSAVPVADQAAYSNFVALASTLNSQLATCITNASGVMSKSAKFLTCFNTFTSGLLAPAEMAQLKLLSPGTQNKIQIYVTAVVAAVNIAVGFLGGSPVVAPVVGAQPTVAQMQPIYNRMSMAAGY